MKRIIEIEEKDLERIREIVERENKTYLSVTTRGTAYITIADSKPYDEIINSAPTVEMPKYSLLPLAGDCDEAYKRGYEHGKAEGILKAHTRPQGEWIKNESRDLRDCFYTCSKCGRSINVICGETLADYPFCHCGVRMKGGAE